MEYTERRQTLETLLDNWEHFWAQASSGLLVPVEPDPSKTLPEDWTLFSSMSKHHSVIECRRVLEVLRDKLPKHYAVVVGYYGAERKTTWGTRRVKTSSGKWTTAPVRVRARVLPSWLTASTVPRCGERECPCGNQMPRMLCRSLDIMLGLWSGSMRLPRPLESRLREMVDESGTHLTEAA